MDLFDDGTPQEWNDFQKDMTAIYTLNKIFLPSNRMALFQAVLRGETMTTFEAAAEKGKEDDDKKVKDLTKAMEKEALNEVIATISPQSYRHPETVDEKVQKKAPEHVI